MLYKLCGVFSQVELIDYAIKRKASPFVLWLLLKSNWNLALPHFLSQQSFNYNDTAALMQMSLFFKER